MIGREPVPATPRRSMTPKRRLEALLKCEGRCAKCREKLGSLFIVDHILPLELGGLDEVGNLETICVSCDKLKTKTDMKRIVKMRRQSKKANEPRKPSTLKSRGFDRTLRKKFDGTVERRASPSNLGPQGPSQSSQTTHGKNVSERLKDAAVRPNTNGETQ